MSRRRMPLAVGWTLAVLAMVLFCSLGTWQWGRAKQKEAMLAATRQVLDQRNPVPLAAAADTARARDYDWAAGDGEFLAGPAVLLDNQTRERRSGVRVYRVFRPAAGGTPLLVELGWLPLPGDRRLPAIATPAGTQRVAGLLVPPPAGGIAGPGITPQPNGDLLVIGMQAETLGEALALPVLAPRVLKLDPALPLGYPRDLDILPNTLPPERHVGYAVQWFALALAMLVMALVLTWHSRRKARQGH